MQPADVRADGPSAAELLIGWLESHLVQEPRIQSLHGKQRFPVLPQQTGSDRMALPPPGRGARRRRRR